MKFLPINCWRVSSAVFDVNVVTNQERAFQLLKKSILKNGFRGFIIDSATGIEQTEWYRGFLKGEKPEFYIEGSGVYKIVNIDLSENEIYFEKLNIPIGFEPKIFYSWQSDYDESYTEIREALVEVIDHINKIRMPRAPLILANDKERPKGGSNQIVEQLKRDIDTALIVVADITNVAQIKDREKSHPNANVIFEMSYAFIKKTYDQVIIIRKHRQDISDNVPFDYYQNNRIDYATLENLKEQLNTHLADCLEKIGYITRLNT